MIQIKIGGQGKLHHLMGILEPPGIVEPDYPQWEQDDLIVCSWMLNNMESYLVHQYTEFSMIKMLWKGLFTTYNKW